MSNKILFTTGIPAKNRLRINGHGMYQFIIKISRPKNSPKALVTSSEFAKENKIMLYPDIITSGEVKITIVNLTPYPVDLENKDHIGTFIALPSCDCKTDNN
jgi:dUTPase